MQISYATLGFTIAGILFLVHSLSFIKLPNDILKKELRFYSFAYLPLSLTFIIWGLLTYFNTTLLAPSIIVGNALLLVSTLIMLLFLFSKKSRSVKIFVFIIGLLLSVIFIWWRINYFFPTPYMLNGILLLDTQRPVSILWALIFIIIWFPACIKAAKIISKNILRPELNYVYSFIYIISTLSAILFISAQTPTLAVITFVMLFLSFSMSLYSNFMIKTLFLKKDTVIPLPISN